MRNLTGIRLYWGLAFSVLFIPSPLLAEDGKIKVEQGNFKIEVSAPDTVKSDDPNEKDVLYLTKWPAKGEPEKEVTATVTPTIKTPADTFWHWHSTEPTPTKHKFKGEPDETFEIKVTFWTYGMMADGVTPDDSCELKATIRMPKVEFFKLEGTDPKDTAFDIQSSNPKLNSGGKHKGEVKVNPKVVAPKILVRLFQYKAGAVKSDKKVTWPDALTAAGEDSDYNAYSGSDKAKVAEEKITIESQDYPGPQSSAGEDGWGATIPPGNTYFKCNLNLYLQYTLKGSDAYKTVGKMEWSVDESLGLVLQRVGTDEYGFPTYKLKQQMIGGSGTTFKTGAASDEDPEAPEAPKLQ